MYRSAVKNTCRTVVRTAVTGGKGGDVIFLVDKGINTLTDYRHRRKFAAEDRRAAKRTATERMVRILYP